MIEQNCDASLGLRQGMWWAAYGGSSVGLPEIMVDSGHQISYGYVSFATVYKNLIDTELARPAGAEIWATALRIGNHFRVSAQLVNHAGVTLSPANVARVHAIVYEDIKVGVTSRTVRAVVSTNVATPVADSASASFTLDTGDISPSDWSKVHVLVVADYRPGGTTGAYDMLQAAYAELGRTTPGDFDANSRSDILWHHAARGEVWTWSMIATEPTSQNYLGAVADTNWQIKGVGDVDADGKADLVWRHATTGDLFLWTMNGASVSSRQYLGAVGTEYAIVGTADYTGDGKADILWRHQGGDLWLWQMNGAAVTAVTRIGEVDPAYEVAGSGDLDGDGKADIVWRHQASGDVWAWLMNGATSKSRTYVGTVADTQYRVVGVSDHTGDLKADILWRHEARGEVWLWRMTGAAVAGNTPVGAVDAGYRIVATGDYDADGRADILWHHATRGEVWLWLMNGATVNSVTWVLTVGDVGYGVVAPR